MKTKIFVFPTVPSEWALKVGPETKIRCFFGKFGVELYKEEFLMPCKGKGKSGKGGRGK